MGGILPGERGWKLRAALPREQHCTQPPAQPALGRHSARRPVPQGTAAELLSFPPPIRELAHKRNKFFRNFKL